MGSVLFWVDGWYFESKVKKIIYSEGINMSNIVHNGIELNAAYEIDYDEEKLGLILHSRSEKYNSEYNQALLSVLTRLQQIGYMSIDIFVVSKKSKKHFSQSERQVLIDETTINLNVENIDDLRKMIGRVVSQKRVNDDVQGGTNSKRILLFHPEISEDMWNNIAKDSIDSLV